MRSGLPRKQGGINGQGELSETEEGVFHALANVHFNGVYFSTQQLLAQIADGGAIVCVSSDLTRIAIPGVWQYEPMKSAVETLVRDWAK